MRYSHAEASSDSDGSAFELFKLGHSRKPDENLHTSAVRPFLHCFLSNVYTYWMLEKVMMASTGDERRESSYAIEYKVMRKPDLNRKKRK